MRNLLSNISNFGIEIIRQGNLLVVCDEVMRALCAHSHAALQWCAGGMSDDMRDARRPWQTSTHGTSGRMVRCFAVAKQPRRQHLVVRSRHVD